jgi:hypothetical protein
MKRVVLFSIVLCILPLSQWAFIQSTQAQNKSQAAPLTQISAYNEATSVNYFYNTNNGIFLARAYDQTQDGQIDYVRVDFLASGISWSLDFSTAGLNKNLTPGFYDKAEKASFASAGHPGLDIGTSNSICSRVRGNFTILDATFDYSTSPPTVVSFAANFVQRCEGGIFALRGSVYYNHTPNKSLTFGRSSVNGGETVQTTVTLNAPAPIGGATVSLFSSDSSLATVPQNVFISQGQNSATFNIQTKIVKSPPSVVILAIYNNIASAETLKVISPIPSITKLEMHSQPGDVIGDGKDYLYLPTTGDFAGQASGNLINNSTDAVSITYFGRMNSDLWEVAFGTYQLGMALLPGTYVNAQRFGFEAPGHPGLAIHGNGRGCNMLTGSFKIIEVTIDRAYSPPDVLSFAAEFEQHCPGDSPALTGTVYYNYTPPGSFVGVFDICLQDESNGNILQIHSPSGNYQFTNCTGFSVVGVGIVSQKGSTISFQHNTADRRLTAKVYIDQNKGNATMQSLSQGITFNLTDRDTRNNRCNCQ